MIWLLAGSAIKKLAAIPLGLALLHGPLNTPDTWVMGRSAYTPAHAVRLGNSTSANTLQGAMSQPVHGVVVDLERWPFYTHPGPAPSGARHERGHHPTWNEAFQVEERCWKRKR
ncbi:hypothetical protein HFQ13_10525 [Acidithiobacillus sp. VAN18-1]|uniref:Uncharacterized protein n=1 Tax=Igneacidithiobacillus copahuensis TaxID=2724909 RepID=A0AAE2YRU5_9PROT|nr:hypothetical protein [Igneacidithiobacillus copahuensis]MBU2788625.1 hypothetical protein [Igneacidithiobacillus copahuensis]MBU2796691.1 hypothetical protein [Acidithiobacillus sp. VAN18-2]